MARRTIGRGKAKEKTMVVCPECGGREFEMEYLGTILMSNVHLVVTKGEETLYQFELAGLGISNLVEPVFTCTNCNTEVIPQLAYHDGRDMLTRWRG
jgi:hypothetical protein